MPLTPGVACPNGLQALVCQLGAREHYLVARCFAKCGALALLATDFWSPVRPPRRGLFSRGPRVILSAMARRHDELGRRQVASFPLLSAARFGIGWFDRKGAYDGTIARWFARGVEALKTPHNVFFGYSYDSLELLQWERRRGGFTVLCQTDPGPAHYRMMSEEEDQWPQYATAQSSWWTQSRAERLREEWDLADLIIANSEWTREAIVAEGADASKIAILPLAFDVESRERGGVGRGQKSEVSGQRSAKSPLRVLFLGTVAVGKGIQYLVEAARLLVEEPIEFTVAGSIRISPGAVQGAPKNMKWLGHIPRSRTDELYKDCDIFIFPTLSDGFGLTQLEALSHGVPVITTPNCGRVVDEGKTGFIIPPRDPEALANAIRRFAINRNISASMAPACRDSVRSYSTKAYSQHLIALIEKYQTQRRRRPALG